jgi:adenylate cyclase class 2
MLHQLAFEDNVVFDDAAGTLRQGGRLLRLRTWAGTQVLTFKGPATFVGSVKQRRELETEIGDGETFGVILGELGLRPVRRYQKRRELWQVDRALVALDETPMGCFVELEGNDVDLPALARGLGLDPSQALRGTYIELWNDHRALHPEAPADMVFGGDAAG